MIYGDIPFTDDKDIVNSEIDFNKFVKKNNNINSFDLNLAQYSSSYNNMSNASKAILDVNDLIKKCLKQNQNERILLEDILKHRWLTTDNK